jgi:hypothetical protein
MAARSVPLRGVYALSAICALFAIGYGALGLEPSPGMGVLLDWAPVIAVAWWLTADSKRTQVIGAYDAGLFFYLTLPLTLPWYALRTRGREGWALMGKLYGLALAGRFGFLLGGVLR